MRVVPARLILLFATAVAVIGVLAAGPGGRPVSQAQQGALFTLSPRDQTVDLAAGTVTFEVRISEVTDLAAFDFILRYDPGVVGQPAVEPGPFLGSTGRHVNCLEPRVDSPENGPGTLQYGCATIAPGTGVSGSGLLATVTFRLTGGRYTPVNFSKVEATNANADPRCVTTCAVQNGSVTVNGGSAEQEEGLSPTPTPVTLPPEPTPVGPRVVDSDGGGSGPDGSGTTGGSSGGPGGAGGGDQPGGSSASGGATGVIGAGQGPGGAPGVGALGDPRATRESPLATGTTLALAIAGAGLAAAALAIRSRSRGMS